MQSHFRIQSLQTAPPHITINPSEQSEPTQGLWGFDLQLHSDRSLPAKIQTCILFHLSISPWHWIFYLQRFIWKRKRNSSNPRFWCHRTRLTPESYVPLQETRLHQQTQWKNPSLGTEGSLESSVKEYTSPWNWIFCWHSSTEPENESLLPKLGCGWSSSVGEATCCLKKQLMAASSCWPWESWGKSLSHGVLGWFFTPEPRENWFAAEIKYWSWSINQKARGGGSHWCSSLNLQHKQSWFPGTGCTQKNSSKILIAVGRNRTQSWIFT